MYSCVPGERKIGREEMREEMKERRERGRKEGEGGKEEERETKENTTLLCCKNGQLTYRSFNLILLPSSSIGLVIPGEMEGGREGERLWYM